MPVIVLAGWLMGRTGQHIAYLLVEVIGPRQVIDGGVDSPPKVLKNHGEYEQAFDDMLKEICAALLSADVNVRLVGTLRKSIKARSYPHPADRRT
jgi:hypothetical protein